MNVGMSVVRMRQRFTPPVVLPKNVVQHARQRHPAAISVTSNAVVHWTESLC